MSSSQEKVNSGEHDIYTCQKCGKCFNSRKKYRSHKEKVSCKVSIKPSKEADNESEYTTNLADTPLNLYPAVSTKSKRDFERVDRRTFRKGNPIEIGKWLQKREEWYGFPFPLSSF